jgi:hypothetical protein
VTNALTSAGLQNVQVQIYSRFQGQIVSAGSANTAASYTVGGLGTGVYFALTANGQGFTNEIYDNILCLYTCSLSTAVASGAEIAVAIGVDTPLRNFRLDMGGTITGTIRDAGTSAPLQTTFVQVYTRIGANVTFVATSSFTPASGASPSQAFQRGRILRWPSIRGARTTSTKSTAPTRRARWGVPTP